MMNMSVLYIQLNNIHIIRTNDEYVGIVYTIHNIHAIRTNDEYVDIVYTIPIICILAFSLITL